MENLVWGFVIGSIFCYKLLVFFRFQILNLLVMRKFAYQCGYIALIFVLLYPSLLLSQITTNEPPVSSYLTGIKDMPIPVFVDPPDMKKINAEDEVNDTVPNTLIRVGVAIPVNFESSVDGKWESLRISIKKS